MRKRIAAALLVGVFVLTAGLGWVAASETRLEPVIVSWPWEHIDTIYSSCVRWETTAPDGSIVCNDPPRGVPARP